MEICKGFGDWFACLKCPDICTTRCPIEKENAIEELRQRFRSIEQVIGYAEQGNILNNFNK